jgi:hypothetical protein
VSVVHPYYQAQKNCLAVNLSCRIAGLFPVSSYTRFEISGIIVRLGITFLNVRMSQKCSLRDLSSTADGYRDS